MRGFNLSLRYIVMLSLMLGLFSCEHRELTDPQDNHYIRVYLDEQIKNITCGIYNENYENPEYNGPITLRAILADPQSGEVISERILRGQGKDERGRYIDGYIVAPSGTYNILIHSVGSSVSKIKNEDNFYKIYSFTDPVNEYYLNFIPVSSQNVSHSLIAQQPEHLFHDISEQIIIPFSKEVDTLRNSHGDYFMAKSMVLSYYVQIRIYGLEWVNSVASLMSGMAGS